MNLSRYIVAMLWSSDLRDLATAEYQSGFPFIPDSVYDILEKDYPTEKVGAKPSGDLSKIKHRIPMGSLSKAQSIDDVSSWIKGLGKNPFPMIVLDKLDGASVSFLYKSGSLVYAATRGDGDIGEDITRNAAIMKGVKKNIPGFSGELRGEIIVKKSDFHNFPGAANTRNSAAGAAKSIHDNSKCRFCSVVYYRIIPYDSDLPESKREELFLIKSFGLETPKASIAKSLEDIESIYDEYVSERRKQLDWDIDGLVIEIDDSEKALSVGTDQYHPEYAIALKFPHDSGVTKLLSVEWQVGGTGRVTPVAVFSPISLGGATISRASLATVRLISEKNLELGSNIVVSRRNDVIPMVERAITEGIAKIKIPTKCPSCKGDLEEVGEYLICKNTGSCSAQLEGAVINYTNKIGVLEWGDAAVKSIVASGLVRNLADIYKLDADDITNLPSEEGRAIGAKNAEKMIEYLHSKNPIPVHVFVGALGIKGISETMSKAVVDAGFSTIEDMLNADAEEISEIQGFGSKRAEEFVNGINNRSDVISEILDYIEVAQVTVGKLTGISFCMTGFRDPELKSAIEAAGGTVKSSVSKDLDYLIQRDKNQKTEKSIKANKIGVDVISIDDAWSMVR